MGDRTTWRKASYSGSGGGNCVEVGGGAGHVSVRGTKQDGRNRRITLTVNAAAWHQITAGLRRP